MGIGFILLSQKLALKNRKREPGILMILTEAAP
jgi:hypothetical protein